MSESKKHNKEWIQVVRRVSFLVFIVSVVVPRLNGQFQRLEPKAWSTYHCDLEQYKRPSDVIFHLREGDATLVLFMRRLTPRALFNNWLTSPRKTKEIRRQNVIGCQSSARPGHDLTYFLLFGFISQQNACRTRMESNFRGDQI